MTLSGFDYSYPEVGATAGDLPAGYRHIERSARLGVSWAVAQHEVMTWGIKTRAGFRLTREHGGNTTAGELVTLHVGFLAEPVRVVYVVDEPNRRGFAYGTRPGHPIVGEESFLVARRDGALWLDIRSFSRVAGAWRAVAPLIRIAQRITHSRYLRALA